MGFMDTIRSTFGGNKEQIEGGIDKAGAHADKFDKAADMAKDAVDKLPGT